jgi:hypothetical protein
MSTKEEREQAWRRYGGDAHDLSDEELQLVIEHRLTDLGHRPPNVKYHRGWHSLDEAERRPSMVPYMVSLKLRGVI